MAAESDSQKDKNLSKETRPVPSQAEGDLQTIEDDLKAKEQEAPAKRPKQEH